MVVNLRSSRRTCQTDYYRCVFCIFAPNYPENALIVLCVTPTELTCCYAITYFVHRAVQPFSICKHLDLYVRKRVHVLILFNINLCVSGKKYNFSDKFWPRAQQKFLATKLVLYLCVNVVAPIYLYICKCTLHVLFIVTDNSTELIKLCFNFVEYASFFTVCTEVDYNIKYVLFYCWKRCYWLFLFIGGALSTIGIPRSKRFLVQQLCRFNIIALKFYNLFEQFAGCSATYWPELFIVITCLICYDIFVINFNIVLSSGLRERLIITIFA